ncbi:response regulator transcription factor [Lacrimispora algidixylanolytica]|uniref:Stage 0 sporulation protein A homolog n=1 Tax=Lacrimispora algidixylanolytica TaxID=94868 RepID=A0A419SYL3_9FIRM|nr:response regulator transcription factor [Lacrimispora algidixylanolytica]RKD30295.1 DNA-binding response regulator [Lacrimispora algidixylanolytica]
MRILLVEDEARLADALEHILKKQGYLVDVSYDGTEGLDMAGTGIYDVIILDRMLPGLDGIEILKHIRTNKMTTPVIFLTAKDAVSSRIEGLDAGADDYLIKPFSKDELLARVRVLSRRSKHLQVNNKFSVASLHLDTMLCEVSIDGEITRLTTTEVQLLELLMRNLGQTLTKEQILDRIWGFNKEVEIKNVELYIFYLRKKVNFEKSGVTIHTIRGVGYSLKEMPSC